MTEHLPATTRTTAVAVHEALPVEAMVAQVQTIQSVMKALMKDGEHYGVIPGTGDKPALLQPGAQKLGFAFQFAPEVLRETEKDLGNGHREVQMIIRLTHRPTGAFVADGVGSCSTLESRYRYRQENTGRPVPPGYWDSRDPSILGGPTFKAQKKDGKWVVVQRVEHQDPADYWNTIRKMAYKRALVHAVLNGTAASDLFTQDVEDMAANGTPMAPPAPAATASSVTTTTPLENGEALMSQNDEYAATVARIEELLDQHKVTDEQSRDDLVRQCSWKKKPFDLCDLHQRRPTLKMAQICADKMSKDLPKLLGLPGANAIPPRISEPLS